MAKKLGEILQQVSDRIPTNRDGNPAGNQPKRPTPEVCAICRGAGFLRMAAPVGDPNFGRLVPCDCRMIEIEDQHRRELESLSNMDTFSEKRFDRFEDSHASASKAFGQAREYADTLSGWLLLSGSVGSGKTHLAASIANEAIAEKRVKTMFMIVPDLLDYLREAFNPKSEVTYDERFETIRSVPLLVLDDLGTENATTWAREKLFQIINHRYNAQLPTVITTNQELESIEERIRSRISDVSLVKHVRMEAPDYRRRGQPPIPNRRTGRSNYSR